MFWSPGKSPGKFFDLEGTYTRSTVYSNIGYLDPGDLQMQTSLYRDDAHIATALFNIKLSGKAARGEPESRAADRSLSPRAAAPPPITSRW